MSDQSSFAVFVAVYEHKGAILPGLTRQFMRHSSILVEVDNGCFDVLHVTGTPGIGLTYNPVRWGDPRTETARLLTMDFVGWMAQNGYEELKQIAQATPIQVSWTWNCQDWVRAVLKAMADRGLITLAQRDEAIRKQQEAVQSPFTTETPNTAALQK